MARDTPSESIFTPEQFCEMLKKASGLPTTAQITQFEFFDKFEEYDRQGVEQTLYISINAGGSGTNAAAHAARRSSTKSIRTAKWKSLSWTATRIRWLRARA